MGTRGRLRVVSTVLLALLAAAPGGLLAQAPPPPPPPAGQPPAPPQLRPEELDQLLAPIALYPDSLLAHVLMAATYPLEVVQAARWVKDNPSVKGDQVVAALRDKPWDPSVKSLAQFPDVLGMLNERLEWRPFPIPLVKDANGWRFDTEAGREEILNRRIGRNELRAIESCEAYVAAQREYASAVREADGVLKFAQQMVSDPGRRNGLYWEADEADDESPLGPLMAAAVAEGRKVAQPGSPPAPYHGYLFKIVKAQGPSAPGGAYGYVINGHMVAGFALVAWPAQYGASGIMTLVVNQNGVVYQKDLGPKTGEIAARITRYDLDRSWRRPQ